MDDSPFWKEPQEFLELAVIYDQQLTVGCWLCEALKLYSQSLVVCI
ncbi:hypothetical protein V426_0693 [Acinetobacter baumannii UH9907]|uniref:Uncharacterized protein n=1 Tax=Acinetobacter baumannii UH5307 TaxID=1398973 RepID=A0ABC9V6H9_ACIBA|nr:hypothetical protein P643_2205 [Acinetobacter baumannii UH10007]ETQ27439.1 hypothetical protein P652_2875 [Acinetobacter baumannii UH14508]ETQ31724.1 hypothetical protein P653_3269 [Acinetobacter baumannii UH15208]ETQ32636.1 hypothetical protein P654_2743 [Acinetobacter baumannii UH16008]ETQ87813.1 hypothetical protein P669_4111 [Acinetobacter baumannii UH5307]ETQ93701.1 hypothetical protein P670_2481 [Acinetobacter baumannii UH5707]ETR35447.1 hypothetical protein P680_3555 [Acinetobacter 